MSAPLDRLRAAGVADPEGLLARANAAWPGGVLSDQVASALAEAADPTLAVASLGRFRDAASDALEAIARDVEAGAALVTLLGASSSMVRWLLAEPADWPRIGAPEAARAPIASLEPRPDPPIDGAPETLAHALRVFKRRRVSLI